MALTTTTLSAALTVNDTSIKVASATGFAKGRLIRVNDEMLTQSADAVGTRIPVIRGDYGTYARVHASGSNAITGANEDFAQPAASQVLRYPLGGRRRKVTSYSAAGAIALPEPGTDSVAVIIGTAALALTIAVPTKDMDGDRLTIVSNGAAAHTLTFAGGLSGASTSYDVVTINATAPAAIDLVACNGLWIALVQVPMAGTVTALTGTVA